MLITKLGISQTSNLQLTFVNFCVDNNVKTNFGVNKNTANATKDKFCYQHRCKATIIQYKIFLIEPKPVLNVQKFSKTAKNSTWPTYLSRLKWNLIRRWVWGIIHAMLNILNIHSLIRLGNVLATPIKTTFFYFLCFYVFLVLVYKKPDIICGKIVSANEQIALTI